MIISIGKSRKDTKWIPKNVTWETLCQKLSQTHRTTETVEEYKKMGKDEKSVRKDIGGFVGGKVVGGNRTKANIQSRSLITLDADFATKVSWINATALLDCAMCCYSTHSHTAKAPRLRYVIPLDREVSPEEYEPIARRVAADIGIDQFDVTTYETSRLMYWPSTPKDGEFVFELQEGNFLSADATLARYFDWKDASEWPIGSTEDTVRNKAAKAQGDPETKPGIIGAFCRTYSIYDAIDSFLSDVYTPCNDSSRYTYIDGTTSAGVVIYQDKFAYSHHSTDPAGGQLCNSFDLVRIHKYGDLDADTDIDCPINKKPSYKAMVKFAQEDSEVKKLIVSEQMAEAKAVFDDDYRPEEPNFDWVSGLTTSAKGVIEATIENMVLILENDPNFAGALAGNDFTNRPCIIKDLPWKKCTDRDNGTAWQDSDSSNLRYYLESNYKLYSTAKLDDAIAVVMRKHSFHPVRNYLNKLTWDGVPRAEHLFIHYLGAEDNSYTRTVTRKWLTAAVGRVMIPGIKFDNLVVLVGAQGIGKSYLGKLLGMGWFSDTFQTVQGKEAYEQLRGHWLIEIGELSVMKKAEVESVKMFISKQEDSYRSAYGRYVEDNKRQCVFYGTTNDDSFLRDRTGNRRFWPIAVKKDRAVHEVFDMTKEDIDQIWAEAATWFKQGEKLYLNSEISKLAAEEQEKYTTVDPRQGVVEDYLDTPLPVNWDKYSKAERRNYIQGLDALPDGVETYTRTQVSVPELGYELFGKEIMQPWEAKDLHNILVGIDGWEKTGKRVRSPYGTQYVYERKEDGKQ